MRSRQRRTRVSVLWPSRVASRSISGCPPARPSFDDQPNRRLAGGCPQFSDSDPRLPFNRGYRGARSAIGPDDRSEESMVWFFTRDQEQLQFETMYDNGAAEFVVRLAWSDGRQSRERFSTFDAFNARVLQLE